MRYTRKWGAVALLGVVLLGGSVDSTAWAKSARHANPGLWIVTDRVVGFVPFTVSVYGKVLGPLPGEIEICRSEVARLTEPGSARLHAGPGVPADTQAAGFDPMGTCLSGRVERTPDGYDYAHEMRFDRPGVYQVQLVMVDREGRRIISNAVQVNAL